MSSYGFRDFPPGTTFSLETDDGLVRLTSRGEGRRWLDVTLDGEPGLLLCYDEPYGGDVAEFRRRIDCLGGPTDGAATEIREGMTALLIYNGSNYIFAIKRVVLS